MSSNLTRMVQQAKQQDAVVLLLGMRLPGNYGQRYTEAFYNVYQQIAEQENVAVVDFFLAGVGGEEGMMQADGVDRKSTRLNSSHVRISYAVFCLKKKRNKRK